MGKLSEIVAAKNFEAKLEAKKAKPSLSKIVKEAIRNVRILTLDIETSPNLAMVWGLWDQNVSLSQLMESGQVMSICAKWYDEKTPMFLSDHHDGHDVMIQKTWELLEEADLVVHYNGTSFDMKHLNAEFVRADMTPPSTYKNIDLMRIVKSQFKFPSNKLDYVADALGLGKKTPHTGFDLWTGCLRGDEKSWALMKKYNIQDVALTERLYDRLRSWIPSHPHFGMFTGDAWSCPNCGNKDLSNHKIGTAHTNVQTYDEMRCPKCGHIVRSQRKQLNPTRTRTSRNG